MVHHGPWLGTDLVKIVLNRMTNWVPCSHLLVVTAVTHWCGVGGGWLVPIMAIWARVTLRQSASIQQQHSGDRGTMDCEMTPPRHNWVSHTASTITTHISRFYNILASLMLIASIVPATNHESGEYSGLAWVKLRQIIWWIENNLQIKAFQIYWKVVG